MRYKTLILIILLSIPAAAPAQSSYIGYKYKGVLPSKRLPNGVVHNGGGLIGDVEAATVHGISQVKRGTTDMLWFESSTGKNASGVTGWKVLDVLSFPRKAKADYIFIYGDPSVSCNRNGSDIPNLVGVGRVISRSQGIFKPSKLWVANLESKKFEPIKIAGVKCEHGEP
ncbi:MAG TPA: hypothetical protein VNA22_08010 [Pyrinomonadaceae bacterium]|nr:hypothetical protein [Pyrinomonadaceae bacterium]